MRRLGVSSIWILHCYHSGLLGVVVVDSFSSSSITSRRSKPRLSPLIRRYGKLIPDEEEEEDDDDDDDEPPEVNVSNFRPPTLTTSLKGRSSPNQRKAMGTSGKSTTTVYCCTNCGCESVQWRGRCPTCNEWNTFQEFAVPRSTASSNNDLASTLFGSGGSSSGLGGGGTRSTRMTPVFGGGGGSADSPPQTWLSGINDYGNNNRPVSVKDVDLQADENQRLLIPDDDEFNMVLGGGLMRGSLLLLGGDPGVGKSTLALQLASQVASLSSPPVGIGMGKPLVESTVGPVWYVSGEETLAQIASRAERLGAATSSQLLLLAETNVNVLAQQVVHAMEPSQQNPIDDATTTPALPPSLLIIDSIQTMMCEAGGSSSPGGVSQVKECMALLLRLAKATQIPILTIGHVTKTGDVAGPRMVEHMVDAVLYLESAASAGMPQASTQYRWLRSQKNRFGSCQNVGLYEFKQGRLEPNPDLDGISAAAMPMEDVEGSAMAISVEGSHRAMVVEVQALVTVTSANFGKKTVDGGGLSYARLQLLLGVLQKHCGVFIGKTRDVYVNVVGCSSSKKSGSALDLSLAVALTSSTVGVPVRGDTVFLAQVGLLGELRMLGDVEARLLQAQRVGFSRAIVAGRRYKQRRAHGMDVFEIPSLKQALELGLTAKIPKRGRKTTRKKASTQGADQSVGEELGLEEYPILDNEDDEHDYQ